MLSASNAANADQSQNSGVADGSAPPLFEALQRQLGLKLESTRAPVDILVVDHIEEPSAD